MLSPHRQYLTWSSAALVFAGYLALASVARVGPVILLIPALFIAIAPLGEWLDARFRAYGIISRAITIAYTCFLPLSGIRLGLMITVVTLAIFIQCYTLIHRKNATNYYHLFLMSLFLLLAACVQSPEPIIGFVMLIFLVSAVWANIMLRVVVEEEQLTRSTTVDLVSLDYLREQGHAGRGGAHSSAIPIMAASVALAAILFTGITFVLMPRMEAGILGRNEVVQQTTGISESVNLATGGTITEDQTPVMLVQFPDEPEGKIGNPDWLYWRVTTLNRYEHNRWSSHETRLLDPGVRTLSNQRRSGRDLNELDRTRRPGTSLVHQAIYIDDVPPMGLPTLDLVQRVRIDSNVRGTQPLWGGDNDFTVRLSKRGTRRLNYEAWSEPGEPSPEELRRAPMDFSDLGSREFDLFTGQRLSETSARLAANLAAGKETLYDRVAAIESYLSGDNYLYTPTLPEITSDSVIDSFINITRRGHCELFATAMALMVRSQGIPARVVKGYRGGEWNKSDHTYTVRASMAHLWVEVWFPGFGWITFDPSPRADLGPQGTLRTIAALLSRAEMKVKMFWFREIVGFDRGAQIRRLRDFSLGIVGALRGNASTTDNGQPNARGSSSLLVPALVLLILMAAGAGAISYSRWLWIPDASTMNRDQRNAVRLYLRLRLRLDKFGVRCAGMTAEDIEAELRSGRWGAPEGALKVVALYNAVRFGKRSLDRYTLAQARKAVANVRPLTP